MSPRIPTVWPLEPHTAAKHFILRRYLGAWYPKLSWTKRVIFIDGFAGPGEYAGGERGSPIIALDAAIQHRHNMSDCEFKYLFIEADPARCAHLKLLIERKEKPANVEIQVTCGEFDDTVAAILDNLDKKGATMAPAFVMIDPFGFKGMPFQLVRRLARHPKLEVLVSFMYESVNRFVTANNVKSHMDELYGCEEWQDVENCTTPDQRRHFLHELYAKQLKDAGFRYVRSFEMRDRGNRTEYFLIFGTHHLEGLKAMKDAMWAVDPTGQYQFSDATDPNQLTLFQPEPAYEQLESMIRAQFRGKEVAIGVIEEFVVAETAFKDTHYKRILKRLEQSEELTVVRSPRKKRGTYPNGTVVRLL